MSLAWAACVIISIPRQDLLIKPYHFISSLSFSIISSEVLCGIRSFGIGFVLTSCETFASQSDLFILSVLAPLYRIALRHLLSTPIRLSSDNIWMELSWIVSRVNIVVSSLTSEPMHSYRILAVEWLCHAMYFVSTAARMTSTVPPKFFWAHERYATSSLAEKKATVSVKRSYYTKSAANWRAPWLTQTNVVVTPFQQTLQAVSSHTWRLSSAVLVEAAAAAGETRK